MRYGVSGFGDTRAVFQCCAPSGYLILTPEGRMMGFIVGGERELGQTEVHQAALFRTMVAYTGRYRFEDGQFITTVDVSWNAAWTGTGLLWHALYESSLLQRQNHLVYRRRRDPEISLHIWLGWRLAIELGVVIDERQELPLPRRVIAWHHAYLYRFLVKNLPYFEVGANSSGRIPIMSTPQGESTRRPTAGRPTGTQSVYQMGTQKDSSSCWTDAHCRKAGRLISLEMSAVAFVSFQ